MHGSGSLRKAGREEGIRKPGSQKRIESGKEENGKELSAATREARAEVPRAIDELARPNYDIDCAS